MKKVIFSICLLIVFSFKSQEEKKLSVVATQSEWIKHFKKLETIRRIADESNMSNPEVKFITRTIDSLEMLFVPQINAQIDKPKSKVTSALVADSTNKK